MHFEPYFINFYPALISITYSVLLVIFSFFIYFKTKDIFEISKSKSLEYFRLAFLFLGVSNFFRVLFYFVMTNPSFLFFERFSFDLVLFFSLLTLIYLTYSMFYNRIKVLFENEYVPFIIAGLIILLKNYFPSRIVPLILSVLLSFYFVALFFISIFKYFNNPKKKKFHSIYLIYILLFISMFFSNLLEAFAIVLPILSSVIYLLGVFAFIFLSIKVLKELVI